MSSPTLDLHPRCVATTGEAFSKPIRTSLKNEGRANLFRHARFSADGTTVVTQNEDHCLRTFVLPTDLLGEHDELLQLEPDCRYQSSTNLQTFALYPNFDLGDMATTLVLSASADIPIRLKNALHYDTTHAVYQFVNTKTEGFRPARSLAFTPSGSHFIAGSDNVVAAFDVARPDAGPISEYILSPGRRAPQTDTCRLSRRGWVSAMKASSGRLLAVGTTEREIAIFEHEGLGRCSHTFALESHEGTGVTGLQWSPCGRYLLIAERNSDMIQVFDIRDSKQEVGRLVGRNARTMQVLDIDVVPTAKGYEAWAGGVDGHVRMWSNPGEQEALHAPDANFNMHDCEYRKSGCCINVLMPF